MPINNMKTIIKIITSSILVFALVVGITLSMVPLNFSGEKNNIAFAQASTGKQIICRGDRDFATFISATIGYDGFVEYWKDIIFRYNSNMCQYLDIDSLLNRLDKVRKKLREAFYFCGNTAKLKTRYYELEAELFYVRKFIDTDNGQFIVINENQLFIDFKEEFSDIFSDEDLLKLWNRLNSKYKTKIDTYKNCDNPTWENLVLKWKEFTESGGGISTALKQAGSSIEKSWDRMENVDMNLGRKFVGGFVDASVNGLPLLEGLEQIGEELAKNFPDGYTFEQLQVAQDVAKRDYDLAALRAGYLTQYKTLYGETSSKFTEKIVGRLQSLNNIIKATFPFENQTIACVRRIVNKQCQ